MVWLGKLIPSSVNPVGLLAYLAVLCLSPTTGFGEGLHYNRLSVNEGLTQSHVTCMAQDADGFIWLGTADGLNRFDGTSIRTYRHDPDDTTTLGHSRIVFLYVDPQDGLWVGSGVGLDRYDPVTDSFHRTPVKFSESRPYPHPGIHTLMTDDDGYLWVGGAGLIRIHPETEEMTTFPIPDDKRQAVNQVYQDSRGRLWVALGAYLPLAPQQGGIYLLDPASGSLTRYPLVSGSGLEPLTDQALVTSVVEDSIGDIWLGSLKEGLFKLDVSQDVFRKVSTGKLSHLNGVWRFQTIPGERILIFAPGTPGNYEFFLYEPRTGFLRTFPAPAKGNPSTSIFLDGFGTLWAGTNGSGAYYGDTESGRFEWIRHDPDNPSTLGNGFVRAIHADDDGTVWVGHLDGMDRIDRVQGTIRRFREDPLDPRSLPASWVQSIYRDRAGFLWVSSDRGGLSRMDPDGKGFTNFRHDPDDATTLNSDETTVILEDRRDRLWVGTLGRGLNRLDPARKKFTRLATAVDGWGAVSAIFEDSRGTVWFGTFSGLGRIDDEKDETVLLMEGGERTPDLLVETPIEAIAERKEEPGILWLGAVGRGLVRFDPERSRADLIPLPGNEGAAANINAIVPDDSGRLWISTEDGLAVHDLSDGETRWFGLDRGLQSLEFNKRAFYRGSDGEIFFGGVDGVNHFHPERMTDNPHPPLVSITSVDIRDHSRTGDRSRIVERIQPGTGEPDLQHSQRDFTFHFVGLHFTDPGLNNYQYRLDGFDDDWHEAGTVRSANFTNLDHGAYTFRVRAANAHGVWSEEEATWAFVIPVPWWETWIFRAAVLLVVIGLIFVWYGWKTRSHRLREEAMEGEIARRTRELEEALSLVESQKDRLGEIDAAKSHFVANISHELRTPLTLVLNPLEEMRDGVFGKVTQEGLQELEVAVRNARRLQRMVDQLLSVARLEAGELKLMVGETDLTGFLGDLVVAFEPLADRKGIELRSEIPADPVPLWFDVDRMEEVVSNLLSNALKFTPSEGVISVRLHAPVVGDFVYIEVEDNGAGIPEDHLPHVLDRFYQVDGMTDVGRPGAGIGLSLVRDLVEIHGGRIRVESKLGKGSCFRVEMRRGRDHFEEGQILSRPADEDSGRRIVQGALDYLIDGEGPQPPPDQDLVDQATVLLVEDNEDMRSLLVRQFVPYYRVVEAENGVEGLAKAREVMPDVVVSDVMMPEMDGNTLCSTMKADFDLEFIPVILLTARAETADKISSLEGGADDYVIKPFNAKELRARVDNLITMRHRLKAWVGEQVGSWSINLGIPGLEPADAGFIKRVTETVDKNMSDEDFGVEELAASLRMSRVHLYRRIRDISDRSPAELIMDARLERGAQLLSKGAGTVSEVAYGVGFKSLAHFSRRFSRKYGKPPSAYRTKPEEFTL